MSKKEQITSFELGIEFALPRDSKAETTAEGEGASSGPPTEFLLIPDSKTIEARDGRVFRIHDREALLQAFNDNAADLPIDVNHNEFAWSPNVDRRAYGWIGGLEAVGEYGVKATKVVWTKLGIEALAEKFYRYISGAFAVSWLEEADGNEVALITRVLNAGLVNRGAMVLPALASERRDNSPGAEVGETMSAKILKQLGLAENATDIQACEAIASLQQKANAGFEATKWAPIDDYRQVAAREATARTELEAANTKVRDLEFRLEHKERVQVAEAAVEHAITVEKKYPPSMRDLLIGMCSTKDGLERFQADAKVRPPVLANVDYTAGGSKPPQSPATTGQSSGESVALTQADRDMAAKIGISDEEYAKSKQQLAGGKK